MLKWIKTSKCEFAKFIRKVGDEYKKNQKVDHKESRK